VSVLLVSGGCAPAATPPEEDLYLLALARIDREIVGAGHIRIHPFLAMGHAEFPQEYGPVAHFNMHDSTTVPAIARRAPGEVYRVCSLGAGGSCLLAETEVGVVLSDKVDLPSGDVGIHALVTDPRPGEELRVLYFITLTGGRGGWRVVGFERVG